MANRKCTIYVRSNGGGRERLLAYPGVDYLPGTIFLLRYKAGNKRVWKTLSATSCGAALVAAKQQELELFQRDMTNYDKHTAITKLQAKPAFVEAVAPAVLPEPKPVIKDT